MDLVSNRSQDWRDFDQRDQAVEQDDRSRQAPASSQRRHASVTASARQVDARTGSRDEAQRFVLGPMSRPALLNDIRRRLNSFAPCTAGYWLLVTDDCSGPPRGIVGAEVMPEYVIERDIPGAGQFTEEQIRDVSVRSLAVLKGIGPQIQWLHSYVTDDRIYCVYLAPDEETVREHARQLGVPANRISAVRRLVDPKRYA